jgi:hypothetical protein
MTPPLDHPFTSFRRTLLFWWLLFVVLQQAERLFLLRDALAVETPSAGVLARTLVTGLRGDFITATMALALAAILAGVGGLLAALAKRRELKGVLLGPIYRRTFMASNVAVGTLLLVLLTVDMGYYTHDRQHLNFVFFEYMGDLFSRSSEAATSNTQAVRQTGAELGQSGKWAVRVAELLALQVAAIWLWWLAFTRAVTPILSRLSLESPMRSNVALTLCIVAGATGFHPQGPYGIRIVEIGSATYYTLAQNPVLFAGEALRAALVSREKLGEVKGLDRLPIDEALRVTREMIAPGQAFPHARYPLVRAIARSEQGVRLARPANVVVIFVEGLDRRYLGRTVRGIRVTPFLDRLKHESVYFEHFFANGVQTSRGLFASFCSYYPRQGASAMKTRYAHDYLCLPSLLRRGGYRTEMVISQHRDLNRLQLFMAQNGLHQLFAESDFAPDAERMELGFSDGALFDFIRARIEALQAAGQPFFMATLTLGTHHPFTVPQTHPEVRALWEEPDQYMAALRYTDIELERFFTRLLKDQLLRNTVVFLLGDHGRHEAVGRSELEKQAGHFTAPLFIWMDDSLRSPDRYRPRTVSAVASQVDLAPTILALNGLTPAVAPFLGRDLSCVLVIDCLAENFAFLSSVYDDMIGLADREGILFYSLRTETLISTDLALEQYETRRTADDPAIAAKYRRLMGLYESANRLLDQNRIWSWTELGDQL